MRSQERTGKRGNRPRVWSARLRLAYAQHIGDRTHRGACSPKLAVSGGPKYSDPRVLPDHPMCLRYQARQCKAGYLTWVRRLRQVGENTDARGCWRKCSHSPKQSASSMHETENALTPFECLENDRLQVGAFASYAKPYVNPKTLARVVALQVSLAKQAMLLRGYAERCPRRGLRKRATI